MSTQVQNSFSDFSLSLPYDMDANSLLSSGEELSDFSYWKYQTILPKHTSMILSDYNKLVQHMRGFLTEEQIVKTFKADKIKQVIKAGEGFIKDKGLRALCDTLDSLEEECEEEGFEKFSEEARENAKKILNFIYPQFPNYDYFIYPTSDQTIDITCDPQKGIGISIVCESDGGVVYFLTWDGHNTIYRCNRIDEDFETNLIKVFNKFNRLTKQNILISFKYPDSFSKEEGSFKKRNFQISSEVSNSLPKKEEKNSSLFFKAI